MDQLDAMRLFIRVAELGSFAAVAQQLGVARSVVTRKVAALEARLGVKLIARSTRRLNLTAAGAGYLEKCREILKLLDAAETDITDDRQEPRGPIRVGLPLIFGVRHLAPLLLEFCGRYPGIELNMDFSDRRINLIEEGADLSIRITDTLGQREVARRLGSASMVVVASPEYLRAHGEPAHPADLAGHECLSYTFSDNSSWRFTVDSHVRNYPIRGRLQANNGDVLMAAAMQGLGIACEPMFIAGPALASGTVRQILAGFPIPELGIHAVLPGNRQVPHRVRVLVEFLAGRLEQDPRWNEWPVSRPA